MQGLAPVICYDPYYLRMVHYLREVIADGHPAMIRLHSAAEYPAPGETLCKVDLEGHAVLLVGYDDDRQAFLLADPWNTEWGGTHSRKRWLSYHEMSMVVVDGTKDLTMIVAPLAVDAVDVEVDGEPALDLKVGFYAPQAIVMDRQNQIVSRVVAELSDDRRTITGEIDGEWRVGETAALRLSGLSQLTGELSLTVRAVIGGDRPYPYRDAVSVTQKRLAPSVASQAVLVA